MMIVYGSQILIPILLSSRSINIPQLISFPQPSPTPCPESEIIPEDVDEISVYFYCDVAVSSRDIVTEYIRHALDVSPLDKDLKAEVFVFSDLDEGAKVEYRWLHAHGSLLGYQYIYNRLKTHLGEAANYGGRSAVFLYIKHSQRSSFTEEVVLHEMHHVMQFELVGYSARFYIPEWLIEGGADFFARQQLEALGVQSIDRTFERERCGYSLDQLDIVQHSELNDCGYIEGEQAVNLLVSVFGREKYYQLFRWAGLKGSLNDDFNEVYGIGLDEFYKSFDNYRNSHYAVMPTIIMPAVTVEP
jgi:hypothetical protein